MHLKRFTTILLLLCSSAVSAFATEDDVVRKTVEKYVQRQFAAIEDDMLQDEMARFTKLTASLKEHVVDGVVYDFRNDPFTVVRAYKVEDVKCDPGQGKAKAKITYTRIARGETYLIKKSPHTKLVLEPDRIEYVNINLVKDKDRWRILDPGVPHISCAAIKRIYSQYQDEEKEREQRLKLSSKAGGASERIRKDYQDIFKMRCE